MLFPGCSFVRRSPRAFPGSFLILRKGRALRIGPRGGLFSVRRARGGRGPGRVDGPNYFWGESGEFRGGGVASLAKWVIPPFPAGFLARREGTGRRCPTVNPLFLSGSGPVFRSVFL